MRLVHRKWEQSAEEVCALSNFSDALHSLLTSNKKIIYPTFLIAWIYLPHFSVSRFYSFFPSLSSVSLCALFLSAASFILSCGQFFSRAVDISLCQLLL